MPAPRPTRALFALALLLGPLAACSTSGDDAASTTTTEVADRVTTTDEATTTTTTDEPTSTTEDPSGGGSNDDPTEDLDCGALAEDGLPEAPETFEVPDGSVTYAHGHAVVLITPEGEEQQCLDLQLSTDSYDDHVLDVDEGNLDLRWEDGDLAFVIGITGQDIEEGVIDAFTRVEVFERVWGDSMHVDCEVSLTGLDATSVDGTVTCEALASFGGEEEPDAEIVAAFHAET